MSTDQVHEKTFLEFVATLFEVTADSISMSTAYESVAAWDSVMHLRLILEVGTQFGAEIPLDEFADIKTLGDLYSYVGKR